MRSSPVTLEGQILRVISYSTGNHTYQTSQGPFTPSVSIKAATTLMTQAILFSLKTVESLKNGLQPQSGAIGGSKGAPDKRPRGPNSLIFM